MGLYDNVVGTCPSCRASFSIQTKVLGPCALEELKQHFGVEWSGSLLLKEGCICGLPIVAISSTRTITTCGGNTFPSTALDGFSNDPSDATHQEHVGGGVTKLRQH